jgi:hypothetical protein
MLIMTSLITSPRKLFVLASAAGATLGLVACGSSGGGSVVSKTTPTVSVSTSAPGSASPSASTDPAAHASTGGTTTTGTGTATTGTTDTTGTTGGGTTGPTLSVNVTTQPTCSSGTNLHTVMGISPVIAWSSTGTTNVRLAIDGPGLYGTFPPTGSTELPFGGCTATDGSTVSHVYSFTTIPGGVTRTVTLTATAHVITNVGLNNAPTSAPATP